MGKNFVLALAALLTILFASFAILAPTPPASATLQDTETYWVMGGILKSSTQLGDIPTTMWKVPYETRLPDLTPNLGHLDIIFGPRNTTTGIVELTIPNDTCVELLQEHAFYDEGPPAFFYKINQTMVANGTGWIFTGPVTPDVDYNVFVNDTGVYFYGPDGQHSATKDATWDDDVFAGNLTVAINTATFGADGIPGTGDEPAGTWGDGVPDSNGSCIMIIPLTLNAYYWKVAINNWDELFISPFPMVMTTGNATGMVIETASYLYPGPDGGMRRPTGATNSSAEGWPWEFLYGQDVHGYINETTGDPIVGPSVPYGHAGWNSYVSFASSWGQLNCNTTLGDLDVFFHVEMRMVRDDCVIPDVTGDEIVDMGDVVINCIAFGSYDEGEVWWFNEGTGNYEFKMFQSANKSFKAKGDLATHVFGIDARGYIDMGDITPMTVVFGDYLNATGPQKPS